MPCRRGMELIKKVYREILVKNATQAERILWGVLKYKRFNGMKWRFQVPMFGWIVDFYCPAALLVIEVDGGYHENKEIKEKDRIKDTVLLSHGIMVLRFKNEEIIDSLSEVNKEIKRVGLLRIKLKKEKRIKLVGIKRVQKSAIEKHKEKVKAEAFVWVKKYQSKADGFNYVSKKKTKKPYRKTKEYVEAVKRAKDSNAQV